MTEDKHGERSSQQLWTSRAAKLMGTSESVVLVLIGVALVLVAVLLLYSSMYDLKEAVQQGPGEIEHRAIADTEHGAAGHDDHGDRVHGGHLAQSHTLNAEPFLVIGVIAGIRRMLVITATSTELEAHPDLFHNTLVELGLLAATVVALAVRDLDSPLQRAQIPKSGARGRRLTLWDNLGFAGSCSPGRRGFCAT